MSPGEGQGRPATPLSPPTSALALAGAGKTNPAGTPGLPPPNFFPAIC